VHLLVYVVVTEEIYLYLYPTDNVTSAKYIISSHILGLLRVRSRILSVTFVKSLDWQVKLLHLWIFSSSMGEGGGGRSVKHFLLNGSKHFRILSAFNCVRNIAGAFKALSETLRVHGQPRGSTLYRNALCWLHCLKITQCYVLLSSH